LHQPSAALKVMLPNYMTLQHVRRQTAAAGLASNLTFIHLFGLSLYPMLPEPSSGSWSYVVFIVLLSERVA
jgi:hypothetical protein